MGQPQVLPPVVFLVGATASGKTAAALWLAERLSIEVINADSRQVYRGMSIGTAKPAAAELTAVPHHLIDVAEPLEGYSLALFLTQARSAIAELQGRGHLPVIVGGTGQYVWGLAEGWQVPPVPSQPAVRERLERDAVSLGAAALHERLARVDSEAAAFIDPRNVRRVVRALEVWEVTGTRFSAQRRKEPPPFAPYLFGLAVPRAELHRRIDVRVDAMLTAGWTGEVRALLAAGCTPDLPAFSSAGYRELAAYLLGELPIEEAVERTKAATHRLARRQATWFRRDDSRITWIESQEALGQALSSLVTVDGRIT